jgi:hypothetical protein
MSEYAPVLMLLALAAALGVVVLAAHEIASQADRAESQAHLAEAAQWQVSQVLADVRRITAEAAERRLRGELP